MLFISSCENIRYFPVSKLLLRTRICSFWSSTVLPSRNLASHLSVVASIPRSEKSPRYNWFRELVYKIHWPLVLYTPPLYWFLRQLFPGSGLLPSQRINYATLAVFLCELFRCMLQDLAALGVAIGRRLCWLRKYRQWKACGKDLPPLSASVPLWELHRHFFVLIGTAILELVSFYEAIFWSERVGLALLILSQCFFNAMAELHIAEDGKCKRVESRTKALMLVGDGVYFIVSLLYYSRVSPLITSSACLFLLLVYLGLKYVRPSSR